MYILKCGQVYACIQYVCIHTYPLVQGCGLAILNVAVFAVLFTIGSICGIFRYTNAHDNSEGNKATQGKAIEHNSALVGFRHLLSR